VSWVEPQWPRRWPDWATVGIATLGPLGRVGWAPGTLGTLAGLLALVAGRNWLPLPALIAAGLALSGLAVGLCGEAERRLGRRDPACVILDEFAVVPFCFLGWPQLAAMAPEPVVFGLGFALFRLFDIAKPLGIRELQQLPGGWGVVVDDLAAALATCASLHLVIRFYALF
jgi:phosphatidylglycerophosphatase A